MFYPIALALCHASFSWCLFFIYTQKTIPLIRHSEQRGREKKGEQRKDDDGVDEDELNSIKESEAVNLLPVLRTEDFSSLPETKWILAAALHYVFMS